MASGGNDESVERVAVVGMAGRFPGASDVHRFWENLCAGIESIRFFSVGELEAAGLDRTLLDQPNYIRAAGHIEGIDQFDAEYFGYSRREAELIDPQQRLFLECACDALENANCVPEVLNGAIGVYAGAGFNLYSINNLIAHLRSDPAQLFATFISSDKDFLATRVAYKLNLKGPALTVQTACSTSLVAVHLACQGLLNYECDAALAGAVNLMIPEKRGYLFQEGMMMSPDGHCRAFDAEARGAVPGSGVAVVVLKRLSEALADGDQVDAIILSSAVNNDGSAKVGYTAPGVSGQAAVISAAHLLAGVNPEAISYIETHGTGTALGDPVEIAALNRAFRRHTTRQAFCAIGSVKTNVGHLDTAAGMAGLIKTVLALKYGRIPPSLHFAKPNPHIDFESSPFFVNTSLSEWRTSGEPRRAGVSSFGIGGTNAHIVLEEPPHARAQAQDPRSADAGTCLMPLSARSPKALVDLAESYSAFLLSEEGRGLNLRDICSTASLRRKHHEYRAAVTGKGHRDLAKGLEAIMRTREADQYPAVQPVSQPQIVFVFSGQGSQWPGMGRQLLKQERIFREAIEQCDEVFREFVDWSLLGELTAPNETSQLDRVDRVQPILFAVQIALAKLWRSWGIEPAAVIGHSMGEVASACVAGSLSLRDAALIICRRSQQLRQISGNGAMVVVELESNEVKERLCAYENQIVVAACNSASSTVLSGDRRSIDELVRDFEQSRIAFMRIEGDVAFHSPQVTPLCPELLRLLSGILARPNSIPIASTVTGTLVNGQAFDAAYWIENVHKPVRFAQAVQQLIAQGFDSFLEISAHPVLLGALKDALRQRGRNGMALPSLRRHEDEASVMLKSLAALYSLGAPVNWTALYPERGQPVRLPAYPWQRQSYWVDPPPRQVPCGPAQNSERAPRMDPVLYHPRDETLGQSDDEGATQTDTERALAVIWSEVLGVTRITLQDNFFDLGGHSLLAIRMLALAGERFGRKIPFTVFLLSPTISGLAVRIEGGKGRWDWSPLVPIQVFGSQPPFFCVTPIMGTAFPYYTLAARLGTEQPFFALQPLGLDRGDKPFTRVEAMAEYYVKAIQQIPTKGPLHLGGWSFGAPVAFEMARILRRQGRPAGSVVLIDTPAPVASQKPSPVETIHFFGGTVLRHLWPYVKAFYRVGLPDSAVSFRGESGKNSLARQMTLLAASLPLLRVFLANLIAQLRYKPQAYPGRVRLLRTETAVRRDTVDPTWGWGELAQGGVDVWRIAGNHMTLLQDPYVNGAAEALKDCLAGSPEQPNGPYVSGDLAK